MESRSLFSLSRSRRGGRRPAGFAAGFTLIEMLVVVLVIVLLAGMTMRMAGVVARNNSISSSRSRVEKVAMACEEFKAIYGKYPPVPFYSDGSQPLGFEFATVQCVPESAARQLVGGGKRNVGWGEGDGEAKFFTFGLLSFFLPRYNGMAYDPDNGVDDGYPRPFAGVDLEKKGARSSARALKQYTDFNKFADGEKFRGDTERDLSAVRRILPILGAKLEVGDMKVSPLGIILRDIRRRPNNTSAGYSEITNVCYTVQDAWSHDLRYSSLPPYETFEIRSAGPDEKFDTRDDIIAGKE